MSADALEEVWKKRRMIMTGGAVGCGAIDILWLCGDDRRLPVWCGRDGGSALQRHMVGHTARNKD